MTPVTDDRVQSIMRGLEAREQRAMKRLVESADDLSNLPGRATARVLAFESGPEKKTMRRLVPANVIPFAEQKRTQAERKTIHGRFMALVPKSSA